MYIGVVQTMPQRVGWDNNMYLFMISHIDIKAFFDSVNVSLFYSRAHQVGWDHNGRSNLIWEIQEIKTNHFQD